MSRFQKVSIVVLACALSWIVGMSLLSLFGNGFLYRVEQPVPVIAVGTDEVTLLYRRHARISLHGTCANELQCQQVYEFGSQPCPLELGWSEFDFVLPLPDGVEGECRYRGTVSYAPFSRFGPTLTYLWQSEMFSP